MSIKKVKISSEKEYDALRQEILKRLELQFILFGIMMTIIAALLGFGVSNSKIAFMIPPVSCIFAFLYKSNVLGILRISHYIAEKYENEESELQWESFSLSQSRLRRFKDKYSFLGGGPFGIFIFPCIISLVIGLLNTKWKGLENIMLCVGAVSVYIIVYLFINFSSQKINNDIDEH